MVSLKNNVSATIDSLTGVLHEYLFVYFYSVPLILAVSIGVGWFLAARALKPFEEVSKAAQQVTSSNLNMQIVTKHNEVEIQRLVRSFNAMVDRRPALVVQPSDASWRPRAESNSTTLMVRDPASMPAQIMRFVSLGRFPSRLPAASALGRSGDRCLWLRGRHRQHLRDEPLLLAGGARPR